MQMLVTLAVFATAIAADAQPLVNGLGGASALVVSPDGAHVYVASRFDDAVAILKRDPATGALSFVESLLNGGGVSEGLAGATALAISADGTVLAVGGRGDRTALFEREPSSGALSLIDADVESSDTPFPGLAMSAEGSHLYQTVERATPTLVVSRRNALGLLEVAQTIELATRGARGAPVVISHDGAHVYALACGRRATCDLTTFARDATTGTLAPVGHDTLGIEVDESPAMAISADDTHLYLVSSEATSGDLWAFRRDAATGRLTGVRAIAEASEPFRLFRRSAVTVSPDGAEVYVASTRGDALVRFRRDATTGALTVIEKLADQEALALALGSTRSVGTSPDGRHVYVASESGAITAFARGDGGGPLALVGTVFDEVGCSPEPRTPCRAATGPEGGKLTIRKHRIAWSWSGRGKGPLVDFGDPRRERNRFTLCAYPSVSSPPAWPERTELVETDCPECWQPTSPRLRFKQATDDPATVRRLKLTRAGNRVDVSFQLRGESVWGIFGPPHTLPFTIQFQSESGACLEARYTKASTTINRTDRFEAHPASR